ncbi:hypothetical protein BGW80DRAFT_1454717 [Lactifluus volemus]|nr:hypothetical protein BGW80DRAFT_1454717 [Lactifluus volemus]
MSDPNLLTGSIVTDSRSPLLNSSTPIPGSPLVSSTRTVAIIKPHALDHRFEIEHKITEAKFEIVKERQMEFDVESDPDTLFELFGDDSRSFTEGPVWVYVLERRRAIEVWNTIMGDADPHLAREQSPTSLRAMFGISRDQNAVMGSPDVETAEIQIASLFVSSPPFPTSDLPSDYSTDGLALALNGSLRSVSSSLNSSHPRRWYTATHPFQGPRNPSITCLSTIVPRTTRAADLRAGATPPKIDRAHAPRTPPSKEALKKMFADVPGHKRTASIAVASTAAPSMPPRMTRAASLRISGAPPPKPVRPKPIITVAQVKAKAAEEARAAAALKEAQAKTFEGVPGHKRRDSLSVASTKVPAVSPRQNRSALLRASKEAPPPSSYQFRSPVSVSRLSMSRSDSSSGISRPASAQGSLNSPRRSLSRMSDAGPSTLRNRPTSLQAPTMEPRQNRSAMLRVAKMANGT